MNRYKNRNIINSEVEMAQNEDDEEIIGGNDGHIPIVDPRLRPHGQLYEDVGEMTIDPSANEKYSLPFRLNWGALVINSYELISRFVYILFLFPMTFLNEVVIRCTNDKILMKNTSVFRHYIYERNTFVPVS